MQRIALFFPRMTGYYHDVVAGIRRYALSHGPWSLRLATVERNFNPMLQWAPDGIVGVFDQPAMKRRLTSHPAPAVMVSGRSAQRGIASVYPDDTAIGRLAGQYLLDRAFTRFAFCGAGARRFSRQRLAGFRDVLAERDLACRTFAYVDDLNPFRDWARSRTPGNRDLAVWLKQLESAFSPRWRCCYSIPCSSR